MQFFGVGILELILILIITMIVVGPERLPQVAAELARWIRRARTYANYVAKDFNEVIADLEKEVGASREDWQEIASLLNRQTSSITQELQRASADLQKATDVEKLIDEPTKVVSIDSAASRHAEKDSTAIKEASVEEPMPAAEPHPEPAASGEEPWYVPGQPRRRRRPSE